MVEHEIFSHVIMNNGETDSLYVALRCDQDIGIRSIKPISLEIHENFSATSPQVILEFVDGYGDFVNHLKPSPLTRFYLDVGKNALTLSRLEMRCVSTTLSNTKAGSTEQVSFRMAFAFHEWDKLISVRYNRGWNNVRHSDVVSDIIRDIGFPSVDISPTTSVDESVVQPYWDNTTMLSYLRSISSTSNGGHVEFGTTTTGEFFFKSIGDMIEEQRLDAINGKLPVIRMEGQITDEVSRAEEYQKNFGYPSYFMSLSGTERYSDAVSHGGGGFISGHYDFDTDTYRTGDVRYSETNNLQMSDWASIQKGDETSRVMHYGGRYPNTPGVVRNRVVDIVDSTNTVSISTEGSFDIHIGKMVELIIPVPPNAESIVPNSLMYSGFYLVSGVMHKIVFKKSTFNTLITLMREGFDGKDMKGYVVSRRGKFVE